MSGFLKMLKSNRVKVISAILLLSLADASGRARTENRFDRVRGVDSVLVTRCDVACHDRKDREQCHRSCLVTPFVKHGSCPDSFQNLSPYAQACVHSCTDDIKCPSAEKCCQHSCGQSATFSTCKPVIGLDSDEGLPPVPENITASKKKGVYLTWSMPDSDDNGLVLYVLQERHHLGAYFNEILLGEWYPIHSTREKYATLKSILKPGHFYQFRVASVNINGTKGFSSVSKGFTLAKPLKLQKPKNLRVEEIKEKNGTVWGMVRWRPANSSIPVDKYKILWSFKLDENEFKYNSDSLITQRTTVPEHKLHYQLKDLLKNKMYYIQVQAVASYGHESLKSGKAQMVLDTSKFENQYEKRGRKGKSG